MEELNDFLVLFSEFHIVKSLKDRFVHEALKKPAKLHSRVCHSVGEIFICLVETNSPPFRPDETCIAICSDGNFPHLEFFPWCDYQDKIGHGLGVLIASEDASRFYCETESDYGQPYVGYQGVVEID